MLVFRLPLAPFSHSKIFAESEARGAWCSPTRTCRCTSLGIKHRNTEIAKPLLQYLNKTMVNFLAKSASLCSSLEFSAYGHKLTKPDYLVGRKIHKNWTK